MKPLLVICASVLVFIACSKGEQPEENRSKVVIDFGELKTRTEVNGPNDMLEFGVYGEMSSQEDASSYTDIFTNERVYRSDESVTGWTYDKTRYWINGRTYHFFGVYPYEINNENRVQIATLKQGNNEYDGFKIAFTTPVSADADLLTAFKTVSISNDATYYSPVNMVFTHAMSKVIIKVAKNNANEFNKIMVTSVSLSGVKKTGNYYCSRETDYTDHWVTEDEIMTISFDNKSTELTTNGINIMDLLLVPQEIATNSIKLTIKYSFYYVNGAFAYENTLERVIPTDKIDEWEPATNYVYSVNLSAEANDIVFGTPTISEWGAAQSSGTIIIE